MGSEIGAEVHLENVPLKYEGLAPWEIWLSEAQERMVIGVPPENLDELIAICEAESVEATVLGTFTDTHKLHVYYDGKIVADLDMDFLHNGLPRATKKAIWERPHHPEPEFDLGNICSRIRKNSQANSAQTLASSATDDLYRILASPNVASKEWVIRQYDHEVQGGIVLKPLVGVENDGPSDACIATPVLGSQKGIIVANGINTKFGDIDPYHSAAASIDEALRNLIAVGGNLDHTALLDNFSWGNPDKPDRLGGLVRAAKACYDIATAYGTPFISGKDSLYNEYRDTTTGEQIAIPPTLLISAICVMPDVSKAVSMDAKSSGNLIYVVGKTYPELGGSHYYAVHGFIGNNAPIVRPDEGKQTMNTLSCAIDQRLVRSCHDCSEGGIGVAAAEMAFAGGLGMQLELVNAPRNADVRADPVLLFSESNSRFIVEISPDKREAFQEIMTGIPMGCIGTVIEGEDFVVEGIHGETIVQTTIDRLKASWQGTFRW
jgi:phosphoribosylformylglycinamidine synthase